MIGIFSGENYQKSSLDLLNLMRRGLSELTFKRHKLISKTYLINIKLMKKYLFLVILALSALQYMPNTADWFSKL